MELFWQGFGYVIDASETKYLVQVFGGSEKILIPKKDALPIDSPLELLMYEKRSPGKDLFTNPHVFAVWHARKNSDPNADAFFESTGQLYYDGRDDLKDVHEHAKKTLEVMAGWRSVLNTS